MNRCLLSIAFACSALLSAAQVVVVPPSRTIPVGKTEVTSLTIAPKGDRILVGTDRGAELFDIESGRRVAKFPYDEDGSSVVYHAAFNNNGEWVVLIGHAGTREVWNVKNGKQDKILTNHRWIPDAVRTRNMGLKKGNSDFDRFYQQVEAIGNGVIAKADKHGTVVFVDDEGNALQRIVYPENKDQHHRAPCLFHGGQFITGTDDGRVLFYDLIKR